MVMVLHIDEGVLVLDCVQIMYYVLCVDLFRIGKFWVIVETSNI